MGFLGFFLSVVVFIYTMMVKLFFATNNCTKIDVGGVSGCPKPEQITHAGC